MSARIISVAHRKGGIGKTTITLHLASALAIEKKYKVLVLDTDSQKSAFEYREHEKENFYSDPPPYSIRTAQPKYLYDDISHNINKYDVIFIDVPRLTEAAGDSQLTTALTYCDSVLIPVVAGDLEGLSTKKYIKLIEGIAQSKKEKDFDFSYFAFLNMKDRRKENEDLVSFMKHLGVPMFKNALSRVKALSVPYTYESVMGTKEGHRRFEPFFKEFLKKFEL